MTHALINLSDETNKVLNMIKAKFNLKDKSQAVEAVVEHYIECEGEPDFKEEFLEKIRKAEKGKFIKVTDFAEHYGLDK